MNNNTSYYTSSSVMINQNGNTQFQQQTHSQKIENGKKIDNYNYTQLVQYNNKSYLLNIHKHNQHIKLSIIEPNTNKVILEKKVSEDKLQSTINNLESILKKHLSKKTSTKLTKLTKSQKKLKLTQIKKKSPLFQNIKSIEKHRTKKNTKRNSSSSKK